MLNFIQIYIRKLWELQKYNIKKTSVGNYLYKLEKLKINGSIHDKFFLFLISSLTNDRVSILIKINNY